MMEHWYNKNAKLPDKGPLTRSWAEKALVTWWIDRDSDKPLPLQWLRRHDMLKLLAHAAQVVASYIPEVVVTKGGAVLKVGHIRWYNGKLMVHLDPPCPRVAVDPTTSNECPECGAQMRTASGGGVKCPACPYWFCY